MIDAESKTQRSLMPNGNAIATVKLNIKVPPEDREEKTEAQLMGKYYATAPHFMATEVIHPWSNIHTGKSLDPNALSEVLAEKTKAIQSGDSREIEAMLLNQAIALQTMFASLSHRAAQNVGSHLGATDTYLRLAFKAQAQSRSTLEALAEMKNPKAIAFVKQANIANQQQVNNTVTLPDAPAARVEKTRKRPNKLLGLTNERLDFGTQGAAISGDTTLETVGKINGRNDRSGKATRKP
jgi:hypothetical protein